MLQRKTARPERNVKAEKFQFTKREKFQRSNSRNVKKHCRGTVPIPRPATPQEPALFRSWAAAGDADGDGEGDGDGDGNGYGDEDEDGDGDGDGGGAGTGDDDEAGAGGGDGDEEWRWT